MTVRSFSESATAELCVPGTLSAGPTVLKGLCEEGPVTMGEASLVRLSEPQATGSVGVRARVLVCE